VDGRGGSSFPYQLMQGKGEGTPSVFQCPIYSLHTGELFSNPQLCKVPTQCEINTFMY